MRRQRRASVEEEEVNLTPMLDVVFIMLIFFIVTASFVKESGLEINRPNAATAVKKERGNILVAISPSGQIWIDTHVRQRPTRPDCPGADRPRHR